MKKISLGTFVAVLMVTIAMFVFAACRATPASPSVSTVTISSEDQEFVAALGSQVKLTIPPGALSQGTTVAIQELAQLKPYDFAGFEPVRLFEISSSGEAEFSQDVTLEFEYRKEALDDTLEVSDQLAIAYFDETYARWHEVDFEVDETNSKVSVQTNHFSLWSLFESKYVTLTGPHFTVYFNKDVNAPLIGSVLSGDPIYEYAAIVRTGLYDAQKAYVDKGLKLPENTRVYIDNWGADREAQWGWYSKNIEIPVTYIYEDELHLVAAHELFHAVQNQYVNFISMDRNRWWVEATADYAAAYLATNYGLKEALKLNYLNTGITSNETFHAYQTAYFVKYLVDNGFDFKGMFEYVMDPQKSAIDALQAYGLEQNISLRTLYNDFAYSVLFEDRINTEKLEADVYTSLVANKLEFDAQGANKISDLVTVDSNYAAKLAGVKIISENDDDITVSLRALEPTSGVMVQYIVASGPDRADVISRDGLDHNPVELTVKEGEYIYFLVTNYAPENGSVTIVINQESQPQPYSHTRTTNFYNNYFMVDVAFNLLANQSFVLSQEIINGDTLNVMLDFPKSDKDIIIDLETVVSNLAFTPEFGAGPNHEAVFKEMYWSTGDGDIYDSQIQLVIPVGETRIKSMGYVIIIDIHNTEEDAFYWGGSATVVGVTVRIMD